MKRYFEFQDAKSYKFWQIENAGSTLTVTYGKIGTTGQRKATDFGAADKAKKEMAKLIAEKTNKGYVEKKTASVKKAKKVTKRIELDYDDGEEGKTLHDELAEFLDTPQAAQVDSLVFAWYNPFRSSPQEALDLLAESADKLPQLKELFVGDIDEEYLQMTWIEQGDYTGIFKAFPNLERLHIKGSTNDLTLSSKPLAHKNLKTLIIECGGLPSDVIGRIAKAKLPNLEHLELYLGVERYGFDGSLKNLRPFMKAGLFPKLTYLGLADSEIADELAVEIADAKVLSQLQTLDLSKGTLTDAGAQALLDSSEILKLKKLDLHHHYLSKGMMKSLKKLPIQVDVSDQQEADDEDDRYPSVTE